ncbi:MAG: hypothetical protein QXW09_06710 [Thermoproteota archaeon]
MKSSSRLIHFLLKVSHVYIKCSMYRSLDFEIVEGHGIGVENVKGTRDDD